MIAANIGTCHRCPQMRLPRGGGDATCASGGEAIAAHAEAGQCPLGRFDAAARPLARRVPLAALPAFVAERQAACAACPRRQGDACGALPAGRNLLMGPRGLPNPAARCPDDPPRWGPAAPALRQL